MNTCDTCKWWSSEHRRNQTCCTNDKVIYGKVGELDTASLETDYAADWYFATSPKFGCIHHELKEGAGVHYKCEVCGAWHITDEHGLTLDQRQASAPAAELSAEAPSEDRT